MKKPQWYTGVTTSDTAGKLSLQLKLNQDCGKPTINQERKALIDIS